ncbi:MAG: PKD domain-containing protein, partial [Calditrichaceae bacterium]
VTGDGGTDSETKTDYITVYAPITADFSGTPVSGDAPLTIDFTDLSTGDVTDWSWDFGDGGTSGVQNPSHEYSTAGTYTVSLTASNSCDSDVISKTDYITVTDPPCNAPLADFTGSPLSGTSPLTVTFTDNSTNSPTSWSWDFGDGGTSSIQNPTHEYANSGNYTIELSVSNSCGSDVVTKTNYISVSEPTANEMHIGQLSVSVQSTWIFRRGKADIKIVDSGGAAVASASVSGKWSGKATDSDNVTTGSDGTAVAYSNWTTGAGTFTFCVNGVSKSGWTYDQSANVATCAGSDGSTSGTEIVANATLDEIEGELGFKLATNSPNPFNPTTTISFVAPVESFVTVELYNILGQRVNTILNGPVSAGINSVTWNGDDATGQLVSSGFYFYKITYDGKHSIISKILMIK